MSDVIISAVTDTINVSVVNSITATTVLDAIGEGQTWQNFTGVRAASTTYTNSTGKSIMVSVEVITGSSITVDGVVAASSGVNDAGNHLHAIVPKNSTYSAAGSIGRWSELRGPTYSTGFIASYQNVSASTTFNFTSSNLGAIGTGNKRIIVAVAYNGGNTPTVQLTSASVAGVSATVLQSTGVAGWEGSAIFYANVNDAIGTISLTFNTTVANGCVIGIYQIINGQNTLVDIDYDVHNATTTTYTTTSALQAGDLVISAFGTGTSTPVWTGDTSDFAYSHNADRLQGASRVASGTSQIITVTGSVYGMLTTAVFR